MRWSKLWLSLGSLVLVACGGVVSDNPLSTDADSVVDERLIGWWEPAPEDGDEGEARKRVLIGRLKGRTNALELVGLDLDSDHQVKIERFRLFTIQLGGSWYLSLTDDKEAEFGLIRYAFDGANRIHVEGLDEDGVAAAIESDAIAGRVERDAELPGRKIKHVRLTASTEKLRTWITKTGADVWVKADGALERIPLPLPGDDSKGK